MFRFIRETEIRTAMLALGVLLIVAANVSLIVGIELMPFRRFRMPRTASNTEARGTAAASMGWPSATPHEIAWPAPTSWQRSRTAGLWYFDVRSENQSDPNADFIMNLWQAGWPFPAIEQKQMWWDSNDPTLAGPAEDPASEILYFGLFLNTLILGGGLWLLVFGPLGVWVIGRRVSWTLRGCCTFCGYDITGLKRCPECGWVPRMRMVQAEAGTTTGKG